MKFYLATALEILKYSKLNKNSTLQTLKSL